MRSTRAPCCRSPTTSTTASAASSGPRGHGSAADNAKRLADYDRGVDEATAAEELILWFEHDLFDQLALIRLLARLARRGLPATLTIVSIDRHPEVPNFLGLGQLDRSAARRAVAAPHAAVARCDRRGGHGVDRDDRGRPARAAVPHQARQGDAVPRRRARAPARGVARSDERPVAHRAPDARGGRARRGQAARS